VGASLTDRLTAEDGTHFLPGLQALVRVPLEQARRDRAAGLRIGTFISGYPGHRSPGSIWPSPASLTCWKVTM